MNSILKEGYSKGINLISIKFSKTFLSFSLNSKNLAFINDILQKFLIGVNSSFSFSSSFSIMEYFSLFSCSINDNIFSFSSV